MLTRVCMTSSAGLQTYRYSNVCTCADSADLRMFVLVSIRREGGGDGSIHTHG